MRLALFCTITRPASPVVGPSAPTLVIRRRPPLMVVVPVKLLALVSVSWPVPRFASLAGLFTLESVISPMTPAKVWLRLLFMVRV